MDAFDALPISCLINKRFLAVHGGISPELRTLDDINSLNRFQEPPRVGLYCDLLWSDPVEKEDGKTAERYKTNSARGCSHYFNTNAVNKFLK